MDKQNSILKAESLSIGYHKAGRKKVVAENLNFHLEKGKLTCLLGPNGVGKSTLIKTIMGQIPAIQGNITLLEKPLREYSLHEISKKISVVLTEKVSTGSLTVRQLVELGRIPHTGWLGQLRQQDKEKVEKAIEATNIQYLSECHLSELSDGQLQKAMIARALAQDGEILILDEPTAHLDLVNRLEIMHLLKKLAKKAHKAILITTHDLEVAIETADVFWLMQCGIPLVIGIPEDLIIRNQMNVLLPGKGLAFDALSGKIIQKDQKNSVNIEGPQIPVIWIKAALAKKGFSKHLKDLHILVTEEPFAIQLIGNQQTKIFYSIESLIDFLEGAN
ncbi:ABC transporter ATP-binding protein [Cecembia calidifontis]|uniref:Iron complex transport system ATP-binding protein n=1 Tax=Cecembia calidifontis TaxID=1187080 RepID=A0A4Q7PAG4_9BACT|nr:ABC transporter ATP-binding protein [Cecembia calidifontis]RZS96598.1 iron complex transport system ATP-binding protein [Cecembia calidifontis]